MDKMLEMLFEPQRWQKAIERGLDKDIRKEQLISLTKPRVRQMLYNMIKDGKYRVSPPHAAEIPKEKKGEFRTVYANEPVDRVLLNIINDIFFELCPEMVHPACRSYLKGEGSGKTVMEVSRVVRDVKREGCIGFKADLSKYFDSVPLRFIDGVFDAVEKKVGESQVVNLVRDYYHSDLYFDCQGEIKTVYKSLKQGCAVSAFLADVLLYETDKVMSGLRGYYVRYCDDILYIGENYEDAYFTLKKMLEGLELTLNPAKVENLYKDKFFKFLGFTIKGETISLSRSRIKKFEKEILDRTIRKRGISPKSAARSVKNYLYSLEGKHSWATQVLPVCNSDSDLITMNSFVMDCIRAVMTGKERVGTLYYIPQGEENGCVGRSKGRNVKANREKTGSLEHLYLSLRCMRNALLTNRVLYNRLLKEF